MKYLFLFLFAVLALSVEAQREAKKTFATDSIVNAGTTNFALGTELRDLGTVFFGVTTTLGTGTAAGTIRYQVSNNDGTTWHTMATDTVTTGAATDASYQLDNCAATHVRIQIVGTGTQKTYTRPSISFKRNY